MTNMIEEMEKRLEGLKNYPTIEELVRIGGELLSLANSYREVAKKYIPISTLVMAFESVDKQAQELFEKGQKR